MYNNFVREYNLMLVSGDIAGITMDSRLRGNDIVRASLSGSFPRRRESMTSNSDWVFKAFSCVSFFTDKIVMHGQWSPLTQPRTSWVDGTPLRYERYYEPVFIGGALVPDLEGIEPWIGRG